MQLTPFRIERWYERHEFTTELMLSSSDCESVSVGELLALEPDARERLASMRLGYTEVPGSEELRSAIAALYMRAGPEDVVALAAAEEGIFAVEHALLGPGATRSSRRRATSRRSRSLGRREPTWTPGAGRTPTAGFTTSRSSSSCSATTRSSSTSTLHTSRPGPRCRTPCSTGSWTSAPSGAPCSSATRCTASWSTTPPAAGRL